MEKELYSSVNSSNVTKKVLRAILVDVIPKEESLEQAHDNLTELKRLVETYGGTVVIKIVQKRGRPSGSTFLGTGKALEVKELSKTLHADVVIFNNMLKPNQVRNLHSMFEVEIWDRVDVILKIFEKHAQTEEAKLQIKLAQLKHAFPKLYGRGSEFSQQAGHRGVRAGAGEKFLENQKRHLRRLIKETEEKLEKMTLIRDGQRLIRKRKNLPVVAIVGYTNSGKSTLLRKLTKKKVVVADKLFSTLDTRIGDLWLEKSQKTVLLADTIGFIQNLPPLLIQSFLSTLREVQEADLLLHIIDIADPKFEQKITVVHGILDALNVGNKSQIYIFNKIDKLSGQNVHFEELAKKHNHHTPMFISAEYGTGLEKLKERLETYKFY